jgi:hypothetical protein
VVGKDIGSLWLATVLYDFMFAKFYWPSLKKILLFMIDGGLLPMPLFGGNSTPRLEFLAELPKGKAGQDIYKGGSSWTN